MERNAKVMKSIILFGILLFALTACNDDDDDGILDNQPVELMYDFSDGPEGWEGDFADYQAGRDDDLELSWEYTSLPEPLDDSQGALFLTGTNLSDDLFMYIKKQVSGLEPNTSYQATFTVQFASDVPDDMVGIGGSPGGSVWIKGGASAIEPMAEVDDMGHLRMNIDKGGQSQGGSNMVVLGDFSNDTDQEVYNLKTVTNEDPLLVTTDDNGDLWLVVGTDSGFEGTTSIFYNQINVVLDNRGLF